MDEDFVRLKSLLEHGRTSSNQRLETDRKSDGFGLDHGVRRAGPGSCKRPGMPGDLLTVVLIAGAAAASVAGGLIALWRKPTSFTPSAYNRRKYIHRRNACVLSAARQHHNGCGSGPFACGVFARVSA
jgi:hypothetical protein